MATNVFCKTPTADLWALLAELQSQGVDLPYTRKLISQVRNEIDRRN